MKIKDIMKSGIQSLSDENIEDINLKCRIILAELLHKNKEYIIIHDDEDIEDEIAKDFFDKIERLKKKEPIQYILNKQEFMGLEFYVDSNVLIPQPDTEILVEETINIAHNMEKMWKNDIEILDLCTGSGAIAISLSKNVKKSHIIASDISYNALEIARKNATQNNVNVEFLESDLFEKINQKEKFNIIVSNPPYIKSNVIPTLSEEVKKEPKIALDGGKDGLDFYKRIVENAKDFLTQEGYLIFEIGFDQKEDVINILNENKYKNIYSKKDYSGNDRIVVAQI